MNRRPPTIRHWPLRFPRRPSTLVLRICVFCIPSSLTGRAVTFAARVRRFFSRPAPLLTPSNLCAFSLSLREQSLGPLKLPSCKPPTPACPEARGTTAFRMNTCKTVSKQRVLSTFRINTYAKPRGRGGIQLFTSDPECFQVVPAACSLRLDEFLAVG